MMQRPWAPGTIAEWLPRNLRLCWGSDGGGGGFGGDGGGGGATTGGGDWGSAGAADFSGSFATGDLGAWAGTAYDASTSGTGAGGGGDWGSFGATDFSGSLSPNPIFTDIAGPNPGVTTGGGDWGSAGTFSAAAADAGPGGAMAGSPSAAGGGGFWGGGDLPGGGLFGDYGGGGFTGGGGGLYGGGGGSFGGFGTAGTSAGGKGGGPLGASNMVSSVTGPAFADTAGSAGGKSSADTAGGRITSDAPTRSEAEVESVAAPEAGPEAGPEAAPEAAAPVQSEGALPGAEAEAGPSLSDAAPAGNIGGSRDAAPAHVGEGSLPSTSAFGPQSLSAALGINDISVGPGPGFGMNTGIMGLNTDTLTQAEGLGPGPGFAATGLQADLGFDSITSSPTNMPGVNWGALFEGAAGPDTTPWGSVFEGAAPSYDPMDSPFTTPISTDTAYTLGGDPALSGQPADPSARSEAFEGAPSNQNVDWGSVFEGTAAMLEESTPSIEAFIPGGRETDFGEPDWGSVFEGAPSNQNVNWDAVFEGAAPTYTAPAAPPISIDTITVEPDTATPVDMMTPEGITAAQHNQAVDVFAALDAAAAAKNASEAAVFDAADQANQDRGAPTPDSTTPPAEQQQDRSGTEAPPPSLIEQAQTAAPGVPLPPARPADVPGLIDMQTQTPGVPMPQARPAEVPQPDDDAPEPQDTTQPPQDPNAPRPPENIPGQVIGARGDYKNSHLDNPRTNSNYRDSGRTDYPQGRPGIDFRTARQAGIEPHFRTGDINVHDLDARLVERINRAMADMPAHLRDGLVATSGWRPAHRGEAHEHAMDPRTSQESVYTRYNPNGRNVGPAARPGGSNHGPGRAIDFLPGPALSWLRANAGRYGLETLGRNFDIPHIQLQGARGIAGARPSAQEQAQQRALDAQNRQLAQERGLIGGGRGNQLAGVPLPPARPSDAPQVEIAQPQPPAETPAARPPPDIPLPPAETPAPVAPVDRPPADIPAPILPAPFMALPARGRADPKWQTERANNILKQATAHLHAKSGQAAFQAASVVAAKELAAAGIPLAMARSLMTKGALDGAIANGYGPGGPNSTVMGFSIWGKVQSTITEGVEAALQGYQPAKGGEVQGPHGFQPDAPAQQRSEVPFGLGHFVAGGRDVGAPPAIEPGQLPGRAEWDAPLPGGLVPNVDPFAGHGIIVDPGELGRGRVMDPDIFPLQQQEQQEYQQNLDPRGQQQASLLDFLSNFNPISTAEARGGRSQPGNLRAPQADPATIASRLSVSRSNVIDELQSNLGLRNTLDLIVTGEVGSQGKAAVLGFLETALNKVAAEASRQGRTPTGRDLLNYLNDRSYFPDTWGKIESGKIKGGALTDDLLAAIAGGSNTTQLSTGNSSATSPGSRFGGNPTNATIGREHYGVENYGHHAAWYNAMGAPEAGRGIGSDYAVGPQDAPPTAASPAPDMPMRGLAKGGRVADDEPVVVGEEGPEVFVPDQPGTVFPHIPQPGKPGNVDRWPKVPAPEYPGRYGGLEREIRRQTRAAQDPQPSLMDLVDSERLRLTPNWYAMLNDPALIALGRSRMDDRREGIDPGAEQYGTEQPAVLPVGTYIPTPAPAADPTNPMAQALGYGSIRRPLRVGRQSYSR